MGFSAAVYLLSKRFGKIPERGLDAAASAYFINVGWLALIAKDLFTGEQLDAIAVALVAFLAFYLSYEFAMFRIREETQRSVSKS